MSRHEQSIPREKLYLVKRGGQWHYRRRVPKSVAVLDGRTYVFQRTGQPIAKRAEAEIIAREINAAVEHRWEMLLDGLEPSAAEQGYSKAVDRARRLGFTYRSVAELVEGNIREVLDRLSALKEDGLLQSPAAVEESWGLPTNRRSLCRSFICGISS